MPCPTINTRLIPLKALMFLVHGGISALLPYMAIHMKSLGITVKATSIILSILPFVSAVGPPLGGAIADKIGNYKAVFIVSTLLSVALHLLLYFITPGFYPVPLQFNSTNSSVNGHFNLSGIVTFTCATNGSVSLYLPQVSCGEGFSEYGLITSLDNQNLKIGRCMTVDCQVRQGPFFLDSGICSGNEGSSLKKCNDTLNAVCITRAKLHSFRVKKCSIHCSIENNHAWKCPPPHTWAGNSTHKLQPEGDWGTTIGLYSFFRLTSTTIMWMAVPLLDALAVTMTQQLKGDLGVQKMFSQIGFALLPPISGILIKKASDMNGFEDYGPAFYLFSAMHIAAAVMVMFLQMNIRIPAQSLFRNLVAVMGDRRVVSMTIVVFLCGCGFGFVTSFLFWYMEEDLHASKLMLGLSQTVSGISGIVTMGCASLLFRVFGHTRLFVAGLIAYAFRFAGLSFIPDNQAYWVLPLQILEGISHSLVAVTAADYAGKLSPKYVASLQGITFAAHYCFGKGFGALVSGFLIAAYGCRITLQIFGVMYLVLAALYYGAHLLFVTRGRNADKKFIEASEDGKLDGEKNEKLLPPYSSPESPIGSVPEPSETKVRADSFDGKLPHKSSYDSESSPIRPDGHPKKQQEPPSYDDAIIPSPPRTSPDDMLIDSLGEDEARALLQYINKPLTQSRPGFNDH